MEDTRWTEVVFYCIRLLTEGRSNREPGREHINSSSQLIEP